MIVGFLQNAYFLPHVKPRYIRQYHEDISFRRAILRMSRTGQRLIKFFGEQAYNEIWWDNNTLETGRQSDASFDPDPAHILKVLLEQKPRIVLTFGQRGAAVVSACWPGHLLGAPHPCYRFATDECFKRMVSDMWPLRYTRTPVLRQAYRQERGSVVIEPLPVCELTRPT